MKRTYSEIRNSVAEKSESESEGGQKFLPPNPLPFCPPERSVSAARSAAINLDFAQKRFELRSVIATNLNMKQAKTLKLLDNIQFIYELALARLELQSFKPDLKITNDFREFKISDIDNLEELKTRLAYFKTVDGTYTDYYRLQKFNQTKSVNQFLTHWIYPYKGKFHPQMTFSLN